MSDAKFDGNNGRTLIVETNDANRTPTPLVVDPVTKRLLVDITGGGGTPGGSDTQVQFNDGGAFGGDAGLVFNKTSDTLTVVNITATGAVLINDSDGNAEIQFKTNGTDRARITGETGGAFVNRSEGAIYFQSGGNSTRLSILADGKVGVGKFTPTTNFQVIGNYQLDDSDGSPTKSYRFRTSGSALDYDFGGANLTISGFPNVDYSGTQKVYMIMGSTFDFVTAQGNWEWKDRSGSNVQHQINGEGGVVFNEQGGDRDFRVEGDTATNLIFADASADFVGIKNAAPACALDVTGEIRASTAGTNSASVVTVGGTQTLTAKTLTAPIIATISNTGTLTLPTSTDTLVGKATTDTFTNKRITRRVGTTASSATPTINTDNTDLFTITALAAAITSMTTNLSGTPTDGQFLQIAITDNGTARAITWGTSFESSGNVTLPTTTVISTRLDVGFVWNAATSKWRCIAVA